MYLQLYSQNFEKYLIVFYPDMLVAKLFSSGISLSSVNKLIKINKYYGLSSKTEHGAPQG